MKTYNISIISPFPIACIGLENILAKEKDFTINKKVNDYTKVIEFVKESNSDIIVARISPGYWKNIRLIEYIRNQKPSLPLLVCSECNDGFYPKSCLEAGANGYVLVTEPPEKIVEAIRNVLKGGKYVSDGVVKIDTALGKYAPPIYSLTERELEIFNLIGQRLSNKKISDSLHIKEETLKSHLSHIRAKFRMNMGEVREYAFQYTTRQTISGVHEKI